MEENEVLKVLEALVDKVMESASNVREYILNIDEDLDEETNEYVNMVDEKMKYILSELF